MSARDHFTMKLKCPKCGHAGIAEVSEDDYPFMKSPHFRIDELPAGFVVTKMADTMNGTIVSCAKCGAPAR